MKYVLNETQLLKFQEFLAECGTTPNIVKTSTDSQLVWKDGPVIQAMKHGAVLVLDEIDQARTSIMALQTIAQGKSYYIKKTNEIVEPQPGFTIVATSNTKGNGDNADMFAGAQIMNQAFIERFAIFLNQQYPDAKTETRILSKLFDDVDDEANKPFIQKLIKVAKATREVMAEGQVEHCLTTRRLAQIVENYNIFRKGYNIAQDERLAFEMAVNRFDKITADAFIQMYNSLTIETETETDTEE